MTALLAHRTQTHHHDLAPQIRGLEVALIQKRLKSHNSGVLEAKDEDVNELERDLEDHKYIEERLDTCVYILQGADLVLSEGRVLHPLLP